MLSWLRRLMTPLSASPTRSARLQLEILEDRCLPLDSLWGIAMAPAVFSQLSNDTLVEHFGDGQVNAVSPATDASLIAKILTNGQPFREDQMWAPTSGSHTSSSAGIQLFISGMNEEQPGLLDSLPAVSVLFPNTPVFAGLSWFCSDGDTGK